jgi:hypothetical protein
VPCFPPFYPVSTWKGHSISLMHLFPCKIYLHQESNFSEPVGDGFGGRVLFPSMSTGLSLDQI